MKKITLDQQQIDAVNALESGKILRGGTGIGKTLTALSFYKKNYSHLPLYVITTSKKRDSHDFENEGLLIGIQGMCVDSWNKIGDFENLKGAFVIFDEQKASGSGKWAKTFVKIAKVNKWIFLSATPGDNWIAYIPIFLANGYYKNRTDFINQHVEYDRFSTFPKIKKIHNIPKLMYLRDQTEVKMVDKRTVVRHDHLIYTSYDKKLYSKITNEYWDIYEDEPIKSMPKRVQLERRLVSSDPSRIAKASEIIDVTPRIIVFYNYLYEKDILKGVCEALGRTYSEYNGQKHEEIPDEVCWAYLVHFSSCEAWNCILTDTCLFYSQNYAWWVEDQAKGRIDRRNTRYKDLHYYILSSHSPIEDAVRAAVLRKKKFNESAYIKNKI